MPWNQLQIPATAEEAQALADVLEGAGACAVTLQDAADQPLYEPAPGETPLWAETTVVGLFDAAPDLDALRSRAAEAVGAGVAERAWRLETVEDRAWERAWMDSFQPMRFGERLWICPSWTPPPDPGAVNILLDPGLVFGTGTHATTALCLEWLDAHPPVDLEVIDYGCGSGVLAIAAARLGARRVIGVDNDPQALTATRDNAAANGVAERIEVHLDRDEPPMHAPLVIANILAGPLMGLAEHLAGLTNHGGRIVLSGILEEQAGDVAAAYAPWFDMAEPASRDGWVRLEGTRK